MGNNEENNEEKIERYRAALETIAEELYMDDAAFWAVADMAAKALGKTRADYRTYLDPPNG